MTSRASTRNGSRRNASLHSHQSSLWTHRQSPVPQYSASKAKLGSIAGADGEKDAVGWEVRTKPGRDVVEFGEDEVIDDIDVDDLRQVMGQFIFRHVRGRDSWPLILWTTTPFHATIDQHFEQDEKNQLGAAFSDPQHHTP